MMPKLHYAPPAYRNSTPNWPWNGEKAASRPSRRSWHASAARPGPSHSLVACELAGVQPSFVTLNGQDPVAFILSQNIQRDLSANQSAVSLASQNTKPSISTMIRMEVL